jgi:hypothetical protein
MREDIDAGRLSLMTRNACNFAEAEHLLYDITVEPAGEVM